MPLELHVSRRAARKIERVVEWWALNRPAAPGAVRLDLVAALNLLLVRPGIGGRVTQASSPGVRRFHLDRVRYWVYYRVRGNRLEVLSVWHASRGQGPSI
ncbi:MAG: type II toxin-antitoxin system RelE/ParE family toxin [Burkholderiales bacterium]|nr:type II toxin-antitoxin system RelE/ParE family toxin [Burkholderiales bacterium]